MAMTLQELNRLIRNNLRQTMPDTYWVQAEVSECKEHYSGHCYLELIQKKDGDDTLCAKARATIWAGTWQTLGAVFAEQTGTRLKPGLKILAEVAVEFHELYGFNLVIKDLDPSYTLGDQAMRRREILKRLEEEGVMNQNKELPWPEIPKQIAVVSSPGAAGLQDFMRQLTENEYGFVFQTAFFPAIMQGQGAAASIIDALDRIAASVLPFDVAVIIRGGGAVADLSCFDEYDLCYFATQFPIPILTGLGHDKDNSILDRVAHTCVKTPTAAAEKLLDCLLERARELDEKTGRLMYQVNRVMETGKRSLHMMPGRLLSRVQNRLLAAQLKVEKSASSIREQAFNALSGERQWQEQVAFRLQKACRTVVNHQTMQLRLLEQSIQSFSPRKVLERGFSLTLHQGRPIRSLADVEAGAVVETRLADGSFTSKIDTKQPNNER